MSTSGVPLALGTVAALAAVAALAERRGSLSDAMRETIFDGITLTIPDELAEASERAWWTWAETFLPEHASDVPRRAHYRTLANRLQAAARRLKPSNQADVDNARRMESAARWLTEMADAADSVRGGRLLGRPRTLGHGDQVRAKGALPFKGMTDGASYIVHLTPTKSGAPMITFRILDSLGRPSRHEVGPFRTGAVEGFLKPLDYVGPGAALYLEQVAPGDLEG